MKRSSLLNTLPTLLVLLLLLLIMGGLPAGIVAGLLFGQAIGQDIFWLAGILVAAFLPLKFVIDQQIKKQASFRLPRIRFSPVIVTLAGLIFFFVVPILWLSTATAFLAGLATYALIESNLFLALAVAFAVQIVTMIRLAEREKQMNIQSNIFTRFENISTPFEMHTVVIREEGYVDASSPPDSQTIRYLSDESDDNDDETITTITLDPMDESQSEND